MTIHRLDETTAQRQPLVCAACGQPSDEDVCALAAEFRRYYPDWSSRRCFDRAWIEAAKGVKPGKEFRARPASAATT